jgi:hypothetical protein
MQILHARPDGRYLCLLDGDEVARLALFKQQSNASEPFSYSAWRSAFMQRLEVLHLDSGTFNAIARATSNQPELFLDEGGEMLRFSAWREAVLSGAWQAMGIGPVRQKALVAALAAVTPE